MSEQEQKSKSYMQELDVWLDQNVFEPLLNEGDEAVMPVRKALHEKVLESYHNGQRTPARPQKGGSYGRRFVH